MLNKYFSSNNLKETAFIFAYGVLLLSARFNSKEFYYFLCMIILLNFFFTDISMLKDEESVKQIIPTFSLMVAKFIVLLSIDSILNLFAVSIKKYYLTVYMIFLAFFIPVFIIAESYLKSKILSIKTYSTVNAKLKSRDAGNNKIANSVLNKIKFQLILGVKEGEVSDNSGDYSFKVGEPFIKKQKITGIIHVSLLCILSIIISLVYSLITFPANWIIILLILSSALIYILILYNIKGKFIINYATVKLHSHEL